MRIAAATVFLGAWLSGTAILWIVAQLMSLDEEWHGWGDVLLNPYIVAAYILASACLLVPAVRLVRRRPSA